MKIISFAVTAVLLSACAPASDSSSDAKAPALEPAKEQASANRLISPESRWQIAAVDGNPAAVEAWLQVDLSSRSISGNAGCNNFSASFEGEPGKLTMGPVAGTKKMCPEAPMAQEKRVFDVLSGLTAIQVNDLGQMVLTGTRGELTAVGAAEK